MALRVSVPTGRIAAPSTLISTERTRLYDAAVLRTLARLRVRKAVLSGNRKRNPSQAAGREVFEASWMKLEPLVGF